MALNKYGYKMNYLKKASRLTKTPDGWYATIYYHIPTGDVEIIQHHLDNFEGMPDGYWEDTNLLFIINTFTPMTMQQIANEIAYKMVDKAKD